MADYPLGADSKRLRGPAFDPFINHMRDAQGRLDGVGPPQPVRARAKIDAVVNQVLPDGWDAVNTMAKGFILLPQGDAKRVHDLAALIEAAEAANTETASHAFGADPQHPHHA
jgi:hypothetical protein